MNIYFLDSEPSEKSSLSKVLKDHTLHFLRSIEEIPSTAEVLSVFINIPVDASLLDTLPALRFVATRSRTHDHIDLDECARRNITVSYVPTYGDHTVAEHTFALMLAVARRLREALAMARNGFSYDALRGFQLRGKTLGVIGTGTIGLHVLGLARGFGMQRIAYDIVPKPWIARRLRFDYVSFPELLRESHIISLHAALTPASYHMLDADAFAKCRAGVVVINTARGGLIDTEALLAAIDTGIVGGAGLDVLEDERVLRGHCERIVGAQIVDHLHGLFQPVEPRPRESERINEITALVHNEQLLSRPNVVFTPHIAFNSAEAAERINRTTAANIEGFLAGRPINVLTPRPLNHRPRRLRSRNLDAGVSAPVSTV